MSFAACPGLNGEAQDDPYSQRWRFQMSKLTFDISMSLDGFIAGPNQTLDEPLGRDGERLHEWAVVSATWRERHGLSGGEVNLDSEVIEESLRGTGATIMGRRMFSGGSGPWENDPNADGWWGEEPPFHHPVFVLTSNPRAPLQKDGGTTFTYVTDGIESALDQARVAAGDKDVVIAGGADVIQQYLDAGLVDEFQIHVAPILLRDGVRLFDEVGGAAVVLECVRAIESPAATHIKYRVAQGPTPGKEAS